MRAIPPCLLFLLASCSGADDQPEAGDRLPGEKQALADAQAMIGEHSERLVAEGTIAQDNAIPPPDGKTD